MWNHHLWEGLLLCVSDRYIQVAELHTRRALGHAAVPVVIDVSEMIEGAFYGAWPAGLCDAESTCMNYMIVNWSWMLWDTWQHRFVKSPLRQCLRPKTGPKNTCLSLAKDGNAWFKASHGLVSNPVLFWTLRCWMAYILSSAVRTYWNRDFSRGLFLLFPIVSCQLQSPNKPS